MTTSFTFSDRLNARSSKGDGKGGDDGETGQRERTNEGKERTEERGKGKGEKGKREKGKGKREKDVPHVGRGSWLWCFGFGRLCLGSLGWFVSLV